MMKRCIQLFKQKGYEFRWAFLAGVFVGTSYIPFPPWALIFCYTPLWLYAVNDKTTTKNSFWGGWITQFVLTLIGFHWIAYTAKVFGQLPWAVSIVALLLFCAFMHLYIPVAVALGTFLKRRLALSKIQTLFVIALLHALLERVWPTIFEWHLGYVFLWARIPIYELADIVGFSGLSALVLLLNAWIATVWILQESNAKKAFGHAVVLALVFCALVGLGLQNGKQWQSTDHEVRTTLIQANIGNSEKIYAEKGRAYQAIIVDKFLQITKSAAEKFPQTDLFIWPETAFPDYLDSHFLGRKHTNQLVTGLSPLQKPLLTGGYSRDPAADTSKDQSTYNALFLVDSQGQNLDKPYRKTELLAFGEYLPFSEQFPFLLKLLPFISNFGRGHGPEAITWKHQGEDIHLGGQICYEGLYPAFTRELAIEGADILVNVTNDSWFGKTFEPHQHLYMTLARAIEVRRPLIRSTNTGISTAILANGDVLQKSPLHEEWAGEFVIKYRKAAPQTFYTLYGHWDWIFILLALFVLVGGGVLNARTHRS